MKNFDVIVVGGGHAGCEAATAAARIGAKTCLITLSFDGIGAMSCNPSIGGVGKGIIVREIDALDGVMGKVIDEAGIHFKILNKSKGPAVWGPRAQADREIYKQVMQQLLASYNNLELKFAEIMDIIVNNDGQAIGVICSEGEIYAKSIVLTTGTFLNGLIHIGDQSEKAGRYGEPASTFLAQKLHNLGLRMGRLKTGTPPRLNADSINWNKLEEQKGDDSPTPFSYLNSEVKQKQISCYIAYTNSITHEIINDSLHLSPMYSGTIKSIGPRYCPSIEDKITRFKDKDRHQVFLEPETLNYDVIYPNGISTSLPKIVQEKLVRSITGLEEVIITRFGYAIEYDYVDPTELNPTLELKKIKGLYLAGQINGTTGYEEAAGQGIIAGANAALSIIGKELKLSRAEAYIGVMIDDLIKNGTSEPYRMMTSRAEFRIFLRPDNADMRLTNKGIEVGLVKEKRAEAFSILNEQLTLSIRKMKDTNVTHKVLEGLDCFILQNGQVKSLYELSSLNNVIDNDLLIKIDPSLKECSSSILERIKIDSMYSNYNKRHQRDLELLASDSNKELPHDLDYSNIKSLSTEIRNKLQLISPKNLADLKSIQGITPSAIIAIQLHLRKHY